MDSLNKSLPGEDHFTDMDGLTIELALSFMLEDTGILLNEEVEADELFNGEVEKTLAIHLGILVVNLPERERLIIRNHYFHGVAFGDLANPLHKRALQKNRPDRGKKHQCSGVGVFSDKRKWAHISTLKHLIVINIKNNKYNSILRNNINVICH
ncbi:MAG: hypothetical protein AB2669_02765 [Candidatus Thiodiazotropha endolucinida]